MGPGEDKAMDGARAIEMHLMYFDFLIGTQARLQYSLQHIQFGYSSNQIFFFSTRPIKFIQRAFDSL